MSEFEYNELSSKIIGSAIEVHKNLGPGLLESVYHTCLMYEFDSRNISYKTQVRLPIHYKRIRLDKYFVIDLLVEDKLILELKAVETILTVHEMQLLTYLKLTNLKLGLLINFNVPVLYEGIRRKINGTL